MRNILIIGAGKSISFLVRYLLEKSEKENLFLTIADIQLENARVLVRDASNVELLKLDIFNESELKTAIEKATIVISMVPARFHIQIAKECLDQRKNLITASYVSDEMKALDEEVKNAGLVFMNEIGLDPGIDHMSAMKVIDEIRDKNGKMILFESFTGGLVAPESDNNLWNYKFTWNPRNVVLAGQGGAAKFIQEGAYKYIPYHKLFRRTEFLTIEGHGRFEGYANRDSLKYRSAYGLDDVLTLYRGTLRRIGFSKAWNMFVQLGMTDDSYVIEDSQNMSYRDFTNAFLPYSPSDAVELKLRHYLKIDQDDIMWDKLVELDLFNKDKRVELEKATPAQILQKILEDKWTLSESDKDMIAMYHKFGYEVNGKKHQIDSTLVVTGEDKTYTAMAKTVGLPIGIATLQILNKRYTTPGVQIPLNKELYLPVLNELETYGIKFNENILPYQGYNPNNVAG